MSDTERTQNEPELAPEAHYAAIVEAFKGNSAVTLGASDKKRFGSGALQTNGKIFAMLSSKGRFVVKLPKPRVDVLVAAGEGERFDPGHGRLMKEWFVVAPTSQEDWLTLAREALVFVATKG